MKRKPTPRVARQKTRQLDETLATVQVPQRPRGGWIAAIRQAFGMNQTQLAKRMGITRPSLAQLEDNETKDTATLAALQRAADALGCDLRYVLVPREPLAEMVANQALHRARQKLGRVNQSQALEASAMAADSFSAAVADLAKELELERPSDLWND
jgi:predicted DNA-binding mobile mystery protein A